MKENTIKDKKMCKYIYIYIFTCKIVNALHLIPAQ